METGEVGHHPSGPSAPRATPRRRLLATSAILSGLMLLCVSALWVRSYWVADFFSYKKRLEPGFVQPSVDSVLRSIHIGYLRTPGALPPGEPTGFSLEGVPAGEVRVLNDRWGFGATARTGFGFAHREVWFPHLLAMVVFALLPLRWLVVSGRLRHRLSKGLCLRCGYDLRGSSGRCPECGVNPLGEPMAG